MAELKRILWVDDELDSLKPHLLFLEGKGFAVTGVMSGDDAIAAVRSTSFDLVLLDEMMPGRDGLSTLEGIKEISPHLPVVMVTKSEEERLMDQAIGKKIDDYVVKPVVPSQILSVIKRHLDSKKIIGSAATQRYISEVNRFNQRLYGPTSPEDWYEAARLAAQWHLNLDENPDQGLRDTHAGTVKEWNVEFTKYIESQYLKWLSSNDRPMLSPDVIKATVIPELAQKRQVVFVLIDCLRLDQWLLIEPMLAEYFSIDRQHYFSILPTATPFSRNSIFAGLFPDEIHKQYPELYTSVDEGSLNRIEDRLLADQLVRNGIKLERPLRYEKVFDNTEAAEVGKRVADYFDAPLAAFVFNFLDILSHTRSTNFILRELASSETEFRSLMRTWFAHSPLFAMLKAYRQRNCTIIITTDHGSILCKRGTMAHGRRDTSTNLRYKYGDNLNADPKTSILVKKPGQWRLPQFTLSTTYLFAKDDHYFVYPNNYNEMVRQFQNSFQHGSISLEEMICPLAILRPR